MAPIKFAVGVIALLGCADLAFRAEVKDTARFRAQSDDTATATKELKSAAFDVRKHGSNGSETGVAAGTQEEQVATETFETDEPSEVEHEDGTPVNENGQSEPKKFGSRGKNMQSKLTRRLMGRPDALDQMAEFWQVPSKNYIKNGVLDQVALIDKIVDKQLGIMPMVAISTAEEKHTDETIVKLIGQSEPRKFVGRGKNIQSKLTRRLKGHPDALDQMAEFWQVPSKNSIKNGVLDQVALIDAIVDKQLGIMPMVAISTAEEKHTDETTVKVTGQSEPQEFVGRGKSIQSTWTSWLKEKWDVLQAMADLWLVPVEDYIKNGVLDPVALLNAINDAQLSIMPMETKAEEKHKDETPVKQNGQSEPRKFKTRPGQLAQSKLTRKLAKYDTDKGVLAALRAEAENCRLVAKDYTNKGVLNRVALIDAIVVQQLLKQC